MKLIYVFLLLTLSLVASASTYAEGSVLTINCAGADVGAEVLVNGEFKGECPLDIKVPAGKLRLMVQKKVDDYNDRIYEQEIRLGEDVVKKIDVVLGVPQLNAEGKKLTLKSPGTELANADKLQEEKKNMCSLS